MVQVLFIAAGGAIGSVFRYLVSTGIYILVGRAFPYGTLTVNVAGSMMIGVLYILFFERMDVSAEWRAGLIIGFLGGFTTFSSFSLETMNLIEAGEQLRALLNVLFNVSLCLLACWSGIVIARQL